MKNVRLYLREAPHTLLLENVVRIEEDLYAEGIVSFCSFPWDPNSNAHSASDIEVAAFHKAQIIGWRWIDQDVPQPNSSESNLYSKPVERIMEDMDRWAKGRAEFSILVLTDELKGLGEMCSRISHRIRERGYASSRANKDQIWIYLDEDRDFRLGTISFHTLSGPSRTRGTRQDLIVLVGFNPTSADHCAQIDALEPCLYDGEDVGKMEVWVDPEWTNISDHIRFH